MEEEEEADYYILTSHFPTAPGLNSKMCEGMHGGEKLGGHQVNPTQYVDGENDKTKVWPF